MMACLAGIINAHSPPVTMDEMRRCCQAMTSKSTARPITRDREPADELRHLYDRLLLEPVSDHAAEERNG